MKVRAGHIRRLRLARAWSQEQLAEMASLSVRTIQRIENGEPAGLETLSALAAVFTVSVAELTETAVAGQQAPAEKLAEAKKRLHREQRFYKSLLTALLLCPLFYLLAPNSGWPVWVAAIWSILLTVRGVRLFMLRDRIEQWKHQRLQMLLRK